MHMIGAGETPHVAARDIRLAPGPRKTPASLARALLGGYFAQPFIHPLLRGDVDPVGGGAPVDRQEPRRPTCSVGEDFGRLRSGAQQKVALHSAGLGRGSPAVDGLDLRWAVGCVQVAGALRRGGRRTTARRTARPARPARQLIGTARSARRGFTEAQAVVGGALHGTVLLLLLLLCRRLPLITLLIVQIVVLVKHYPQPGNGPGSSPARSALRGESAHVRLVRRLRHPYRLGFRLHLGRRSGRHVRGVSGVR
mmetsp:Transcript_16855/g.40246  ORF Transcript_16855/g.40246 Transcript_16855/m.40246 type:complete len:253 (-) Transcript_16855:238-996(-)